jgi:hypothetical protein
MKQKTTKNCANPECQNEFKLYKTTDKFCSMSCLSKCTPKKVKKTNSLGFTKDFINTVRKTPIKRSQKPIKKVSKKQAVILAKYSVLRIQFLGRPENKFCFIEGCGKLATTIEHQKGRKGFADEWAKENNISLTIDERFFKPCCLFHNLELENNPELSKKYQLSKIHQGGK